jgi:flagellin-like hook-associated protein FlgL
MLDEIDNMSLRAEFNTRTIMDGSYAGLEINDAFSPSAPLWLDGPRINPEGFPFKLSDPFDLARGAIDSFVLQQLDMWSSDTASVPSPFLQEHVESGVFSAPLSAALLAAMSGSITFTGPAPVFEEIPAVQPNPNNGLWIQNGPNAGGGMRMHLAGTSTRLLGIENINVLHESGTMIHQQIEALDRALAVTSGNRGTLGATHNRLEYTIESLEITSENLNTAISRISDADMAREVLNSSKATTMFQASQAMLAHAKQMPQAVLQLLGQ